MDSITLASDELSHRACVTDVKENSTSDKMHVTHKPPLKNDKGALLRQLCDEFAKKIQLKLAIERKLSSVKTWRAVAEHNIMEPRAVPDHHHQLTLADVCCVSAICYPNLDFPESSISTKEMEWSCKPSNLKQSLLPSRRLATLLGASFAP